MCHCVKGIDATGEYGKHSLHLWLCQQKSCFITLMNCVDHKMFFRMATKNSLKPKQIDVDFDITSVHILEILKFNFVTKCLCLVEDIQCVSYI